MKSEQNQRGQPLSRRTFTAAGAATLAAGCAGFEPDPAAPPSDPLIARTAHGLVRGQIEDGVRVFKAIPYGAPTAGANRFRPPQPPVAWSGVKDCFEYGPRCPQPAPSASFAMWRSWVRPVLDSEDCLVLNVWTPAMRDNRRRPVMVWFHGGGFAQYDGSSPAYDGVNLCNKHDVVVVTLNHRLNIFGYLYLGELAGPDYLASGNAGQLDLVHALRWVRDNIAEFGGDPTNVTIFGESGGGAKVCTIMAMPAAHGLFHKAIVQSGPMIRGVPPAFATAQTRRILEHLQIPENEAVPRLQAASQQELVAAFVAIGGAGAGGRGFAPVVDAAALPRDPFEPDATPLCANVPLMIGMNAHEMTIFNQDPALWSLTWETLSARAAPFLAGGDAAHILAEFRRLRPNATPSQIYQAIASERFMGQNSKIIAERKSAQPAGTFMYYFTWETPVDNGRWGSAHALEIAFVFDTLSKSTSFVGENAPQALADAMSAAWTRFARSGDPGWARYDPATRATMVFGDESGVVNDPHGEERALLRDLPSMR